MPRTKMTARKSTGGVPRFQLAVMAPRRPISPSDQPVPGQESSSDSQTDDIDSDEVEMWDSEDGQREYSLDRRTGIITVREVENQRPAMANGTPGNPPEDEILVAEATADRTAARACMLRLNGWTNNVQENGSETFTKEFVFRDFNQAWEFMCLVTVRLRTMNHHPDWRHVRNKVRVTLPSPEVNGLSTKDSSLASFMEDIAVEMSH